MMQRLQQEQILIFDVLYRVAAVVPKGTVVLVGRGSIARSCKGRRSQCEPALATRFGSTTWCEDAVNFYDSVLRIHQTSCWLARISLPTRVGKIEVMSFGEARNAHLKGGMRLGKDQKKGEPLLGYSSGCPRGSKA